MGNIDLSALVKHWDYLQALVDGLDRADAQAEQAMVISARRADETQAGGFEVYIHARQLIEAALEHLRSIRQLIDHGITPWSPWVLLRASYEAAAISAWLLDPESGIERRRRGLRRSVEDRRQWALWHEPFAKTDRAAYMQFQQQNDEHKQEHQRLAASLGMTAGQVNASPTLVDEIPKLRILQSTGVDPKWFASLWRSLSGMTHGLPYAMMANTREHSSRQRPGGQSQIRAIDDTSWLAHAHGCSLLLLDAMMLYQERAAPTKQQPGARAGATSLT